MEGLHGRVGLQAPAGRDGVVSSIVYDGLSAYFDENPPIAKRIAALEKFAGGREAAIVETAAAGPWS